VGASALRLAGSDAQQAAVLPGVVDGSIILSLAVDEGARHNPAQTACTATAQGDGFVLKGEKRFVLEGMSATHFIVPARTAGAPGEEAGLTLFLVAADATGLSRTGLSLVDSRGYADLTLDNVAVGADAVLGEVDGAFPVLDAILDRARAGLSAEMMGTAGQAFAMLVDFLKTREQFGRVIGSFQALGHRAAQMFTDQQLARSCAEAALASIDNDAPASTVAEMASLAKARVGDHLHLVSRELIQMHGGIGMTDEYDAGFYLKRARALEATYGSQAFHRERYASLLGY
jgi:alkylation response protein AidB-like acyl-CoA dehydrogenase